MLAVGNSFITGFSNINPYNRNKNQNNIEKPDKVFLTTACKVTFTANTFDIHNALKARALVKFNLPPENPVFFKGKYIPAEAESNIVNKYKDYSNPRIAIFDDIVQAVKDLDIEVDSNVLDEMIQLADKCLNIPATQVPDMSKYVEIHPSVIKDVMKRRLIKEIPDKIDHGCITDKDSPLVKASVNPEEIMTTQRKLPEIPVTERVYSHNGEPVITVWTSDREEKHLPPELQRLLLNPENAIKSIPEIFEKLTAERTKVSKYSTEPNAPLNQLKTTFYSQDLRAKIDGLSDLEQVRQLKEFMQEHNNNEIITNDLDAFPVPSSFRRAMLIPDTTKDNIDRLYELKVPGNLIMKKFNSLSSFFAGVQFAEMGIPEDSFYTPVAAITIHNGSKNNLLSYDSLEFNDRYDWRNKPVEDINIVICKRPDGIRLPEITGGVTTEEIDKERANLRFINRHFSHIPEEQLLEDITKRYFAIQGMLHGAIGLSDDCLGNYVLTPEGKVVSVIDLERPKKEDRKDWYLIENMLENKEINTDSEAWYYISDVLPEFVKAMYPDTKVSRDEYMEIFTDNVKKGKELREKYVQNRKHK